MKFFTSTLVALCLAAADAALERSYTDDYGITHKTTIEKPTIVTFAHSAVSFFDYGTYNTNEICIFYNSFLSRYISDEAVFATFSFQVLVPINLSEPTENTL